MKHRLTTEISGRSSGRAFQFGLEGCRRRLLYRLRSLRAVLITQLGSLGADPIQEEIDGSLTLTVQLNHFLEIKRWVLSFGKNCQVLGPAALRKQVATELRETLDMYREEKAQ